MQPISRTNYGNLDSFGVVTRESPQPSERGRLTTPCAPSRYTLLSLRNGTIQSAIEL
jgi:hypothetical protein